MIETEAVKVMIAEGDPLALAAIVPDLVCEIEVLRCKLAEAEYEAEAAHQ